MFKLPPKLPSARVAPTRQAGAVIGQQAVIHKAKDKTETVVHEKQTEFQTLANDFTGPVGMSGVGMGLTIPGPEKSYMSARVDAFSYIPHGPSAEQAKAAMEVASALVQEQIEADSAEVREFFESLKRG